MVMDTPGQDIDKVNTAFADLVKRQKGEAYSYVNYGLLLHDKVFRGEIFAFY